MQDIKNDGVETYVKKEKTILSKINFFRTLKINWRFVAIQEGFIIYEKVEPQ